MVMVYHGQKESIWNELTAGKVKWKRNQAAFIQKCLPLSMEMIEGIRTQGLCHKSNL